MMPPRPLKFQLSTLGRVPPVVATPLPHIPHLIQHICLQHIGKVEAGSQLLGQARLACSMQAVCRRSDAAAPAQG